jgi:L-methionine (R)-S-oxide reductase
MKTSTKHGRYLRVYSQIKELIEKTDNKTAKMSTICAVLHNKFDYFFWTGFYLLDEDELIVHTYQGSVACIKLKKDTGVCWAGINSGKTIIVPDVHEFPGHIACDSRSESEIVIPIRDNKGKIIGVLDVDSTEKNSFDQEDLIGLERIVDLISK